MAHNEDIILDLNKLREGMSLDTGLNSGSLLLRSALAAIILDVVLLLN